MCPPGVDQTTRTPQSWQIIAPELHKTIHLGREDWGDCNSDADDHLPEKLWQMLAIQSSTPPRTSKLRLRDTGASNGSFNLISPEIFDMIFGHLEDRKDIIALGLASTGLWRLVLYHIHAEYAAGVAPLAGTRLIFLGNYSEDVPDALMEDGKIVCEIALSHKYNRRTPVRSYYWACHAYKAPLTNKERSNFYLEALDSIILQDNTNYGRRDQQFLKEDLAWRGREKEDDKWVLRNLVTKTFVRSEGLGSGPPNIELGSVLLAQIVWTSMLRNGSDDLDKYRGKWAGHRFEIVSAEVHQQEEAGWKDVTESLRKA